MGVSFHSQICLCFNIFNRLIICSQNWWECFVRYRTTPKSDHENLSLILFSFFFICIYPYNIIKKTLFMFFLAVSNFLLDWQRFQKSKINTWIEQPNGYNARVSRCKHNRQRRLEFAKKCIDYGFKFWKNVIFLDKRKFTIFSSDETEACIVSKNISVSHNIIRVFVKLHFQIQKHSV